MSPTIRPAEHASIPGQQLLIFAFRLGGGQSSAATDMQARRSADWEEALTRTTCTGLILSHQSVIPSARSTILAVGCSGKNGPANVSNSTSHLEPTRCRRLNCDPMRGLRICTT